MRLEREQERVSVVDDQRGSPTWAHDLAARAQPLKCTAFTTAQTVGDHGFGLAKRSSPNSVPIQTSRSRGNRYLCATRTTADLLCPRHKAPHPGVPLPRRRPLNDTW